MGIVESISLEGKFENGYSYFPAIIRVDNPDGRMLTGMSVDYNLVASQSDDTLLVPVQAVKYTEGGTCLFIQAGEKPSERPGRRGAGAGHPRGLLCRARSRWASPTTRTPRSRRAPTEGTVVFTQYMSDTGQLRTCPAAAVPS